MTKNKLKFNIIFLSFIFTLLFASNVQASGFVLSDNEINVKKGNVVSVDVYLSLDETSYTFSFSMSFDKKILKVENWKGEEGLMNILVPDYDLIDNSNGEIIKTAGFPGGANGLKKIGIITFVAKEDGKANFTVNEKSFILNENGENILR